MICVMCTMTYIGVHVRIGPEMEEGNVLTQPSKESAD